jgi:hypothetical protein
MTVGIVSFEGASHMKAPDGTPYGRNYGGVGEAQNALLIGLKGRKDVNVHMFTPTGDAEQKEVVVKRHGNITYHLLPGYGGIGGVYSPEEVKKLGKRASKYMQDLMDSGAFRPDVVNTVGYPGASPQITSMLRRRNIPSVNASHGNEWWFKVGGLAKLFGREKPGVLPERKYILKREFHAADVHDRTVVPRFTLGNASVDSVEAQAEEFRPNEAKGHLV